MLLEEILMIFIVKKQLIKINTLKRSNYEINTKIDNIPKINKKDQKVV